MGLQTLLCTQPETDQERSNREIERRIKREADLQRRTYKILLLGTGGCGKSTFLKQMKVIESKDGLMEEPFPLEEREGTWRRKVHENIFTGIQEILKQMD